MKTKQALIWTGFIQLLFLGLLSSSLAEEISYTKSMKTNKNIQKAIEGLRIIDDREHLLPESGLIQNGVPDFFNLVMGFYVGPMSTISGTHFPATKDSRTDP